MFMKKSTEYSLQSTIQLLTPRGHQGSCGINDSNGCGRGLEFSLEKGFRVQGLLESFILHDPTGQQQSLYKTIYTGQQSLHKTAYTAQQRHVDTFPDHTYMYGRPHVDYSQLERFREYSVVSICASVECCHPEQCGDCYGRHYGDPDATCTLLSH